MYALIEMAYVKQTWKYHTYLCVWVVWLRFLKWERFCRCGVAYLYNITRRADYSWRYSWVWDGNHQWHSITSLSAVSPSLSTIPPISPIPTFSISIPFSISVSISVPPTPERRILLVVVVVFNFRQLFFCECFRTSLNDEWRCDVDFLFEFVMRLIIPSLFPSPSLPLYLNTVCLIS